MGLCVVFCVYYCYKNRRQFQRDSSPFGTSERESMTKNEDDRSSIIPTHRSPGCCCCCCCCCWGRKMCVCVRTMDNTQKKVREPRAQTSYGNPSYSSARSHHWEAKRDDENSDYIQTLPHIILPKYKDRLYINMTSKLYLYFGTDWSDRGTYE